MRVTDQALRALVQAAGEARALGDGPVDSYHLLLGLADAEGGARHVLGSGPERLREVPAAVGTPLPLAAAVVESAVGHAYAHGRDRATTADILFAALGPGDGPVASVLSAAGADPARIRAALAGGDHGDCCGETGVSGLRPLLAEMGGRAGPVPGRARAVARVVGGLVPYVLLYCVVLAVAWDTSGPEVILAVGAAALPLRLLIGAVVVHRRIRRAVARVPAAVPLPGAARPLPDRLGLRELHVRIQPGPAQDRCYRRGRRAWIVLSEDTEAHPETARFVLWHEVAHLARRDVTAWLLGGAVSGSLLTAAVAGFDPGAVAIATTGMAVLSVASHWWSEVACDRFAVRQAGPAAFHAWAARHRADLAALRRQKKRHWARAKSLLTHPPLALRTALQPNPAEKDRGPREDSFGHGVGSGAGRS
jgi:Zn-dependent protease with chaperone function